MSLDKNPNTANSLTTQDQADDNFEASIRHDWSHKEVRQLFALPFHDLIHHAHSVHRRFFDHNEIQLSTLLNIKSGGCPEDCAYCPQSVRYKAGVEDTPLMETDEVVEAAKLAKEKGATRFCMGAAWRSPKDRDMAKIEEMITAVKKLGLETCVTIGMLNNHQAQRLKSVGLDFYNHNLDTSPEFYKQIITTRDYQDRLDTLENVRDAGINVCCGGIVGMGEGAEDRASLLRQLSNMKTHPESVPINMLVKVAGTPLASAEGIDPLEIVRTIAVTRIMMPASYVRLSAGRNEMSEELQALCFYSGANSIFYGEKLLTTDNPQRQRDMALFEKLGIRVMQ